MTYVCEGMFEYCISLKNIVLPVSVKRIERNAFRKCVNLETVVLPDGLLRIDSLAFEDCGLKHLDIPKTVSYIDDTAFDGCYDLVIRAPRGSYAASFARRNAIRLVYTGEIEEPPKKGLLARLFSKKQRYMDF